MSLLVHTVADVNEQIARGHSFFRDVIAEGIVLHDAGRGAIAAVTSRVNGSRCVRLHASPGAAETG